MEAYAVFKGLCIVGFAAVVCVVIVVALWKRIG